MLKMGVKWGGGGTGGTASRREQLAAFMELKDTGGGGGDACRNAEFVFGHVISDVPVSHPGEDAKWRLYVQI